jgi:hypothetical protein
MPVKRRTNKRREALCEDAERWLRGEPSGFFEFKDADDLAALWAEYGDPAVAYGTTRQGCRRLGIRPNI